MAEKNIQGDYYLTGVMETGCGIKLNPDNTFEFFYSYGVLDRHGYGSWKKLAENEIELNTNYDNLAPFTIILEEKRTHSGTLITIPNYNKMLLDNTKIEIVSGDIKEESIADANNFFVFKSAGADKIIVTCLFYFDNFATIIPTDTLNNYFELAPNHNLPLVHFNRSKFKLEENALVGKLHLLDDFKDYRFEM